MRSPIPAVIVPSEAGVRDFADEVRRIFQELGRALGTDVLAGECTPPLDVYETEQAVEITMDLPGVAPAALRIVVKGSTVLIAGEKAPRRGRGDASFHLVERGFGRFARTVRLLVACDAGNARATLGDGELRVVLPKVRDRRGRAIEVKLETMA
jgi:HSP20 family protein